MQPSFGFGPSYLMTKTVPLVVITPSQPLNPVVSAGHFSPITEDNIPPRPPTPPPREDHISTQSGNNNIPMRQKYLSNR